MMQLVQNILLRHFTRKFLLRGGGGGGVGGKEIQTIQETLFVIIYLYLGSSMCFLFSASKLN